MVIAGAGFGGLTAAMRLRGVDADVTVIDRRNHHLFQPLLYQVATAALSPADIAAPIRGILARAANIDVVLGSVTGIDVEGRAVLVRSFPVTGGGGTARVIESMPKMYWPRPPVACHFREEHVS